MLRQTFSSWACVEAPCEGWEEAAYLMMLESKEN